MLYPFNTFMENFSMGICDLNGQFIWSLHKCYEICNNFEDAHESLLVKIVYVILILLFSENH